MDDFLHRIEVLLTTRRWSRKQLAIEADINPATVQAYWSKRRYPKAEDLVRIASLLNTTVEYLVTGSNPPVEASVSPTAQEVVRILDKMSPEEQIQVLAIVRTYSLLYIRRALDMPLRAAENPDP